MTYHLQVPATTSESAHLQGIAALLLLGCCGWAAVGAHLDVMESCADWERGAGGHSDFRVDINLPHVGFSRGPGEVLHG